MKTKEELAKELNKLIISAIHNKPYEEAVKDEGGTMTVFDYELNKYPLLVEKHRYFQHEHPVGTLVYCYRPMENDLSRVMAALGDRFWEVADTHLFSIGNIGLVFHNEERPDETWKLLVNGRTATVEDQSIETIEALINLLTNK